jgi:mRNA degradation ribonuclease J1/J2
VSGHASKTEPKELIGKIAPLKIIPIHTMETNSFAEMLDKE